MTPKRLLVHLFFVLLLPLVVAWFGLSVGVTIILVLLLLAWRWAIALSAIVAPEKLPELELETISASHFVEKVRWCMDRLGVAYRERPVVGVIGVFFTGRSVPRLKMTTGIVRSSIGNSPEILRYLWGRYAVELGENACFLRPTQQRIDWEKRLDRYGVNMQVWVYYHILDKKSLALHAWGANSTVFPLWQRLLVKSTYPLLCVLMRKAFSITRGNYQKSVGHIETLLAELDNKLSDGRESIIDGDAFNFVDITFASLSVLWVLPERFAGGRSEHVRIHLEDTPVAMQADIAKWRENYPHAYTFIQRVYEQQR